MTRKGKGNNKNLNKKFLNNIPTKNLYINSPLFYDTVKINEDLTLTELEELIIEKTVPYIECYSKCPASNLCKYANKEVKCPPKAELIKIFISSISSYFKLNNPEEVQNFIDSIIFYSEFAANCFVASNSFFNKDWINWWGEFGKNLPFFDAKNIYELSHKFCKAYMKLNPNLKIKKILIVEGDSEEIFFNRVLMPKRYFPKIDRIINIKGEGNIKRAKLLIQELINHGNSVFVLGDGDGILPNLVKKGAFPKNCHYHILKKSFEDCFPKQIIEEAFKQSLNSDYHDLVEKSINESFSSPYKTFSNCLKKRLIQKIRDDKKRAKIVHSESKKAVAKKLGDYIHKNITYWSKKTVSKSEIEEVIKKILFSF